MQAEHTGLSKQGIRSVTQQGQDGFNTAEDKVFHAQLHTHPFNGPFSGTTQVSRYQKGKTNLDFTEPRDSEWQWRHLGHMQVCTSLQTDNQASIPPLSCLPDKNLSVLSLTFSF